MATAKMRGDQPARNPANISDLVAEYEAASAAFSATHADTLAEEEAGPYRAAQDRLLAAVHALRDARPTNPADLAKQLRWIVTDQEDLFQDPLDEILEHVADQFDKCGRLDFDSLEDVLSDLRAAVELTQALPMMCYTEIETCKQFDRQATYLLDRLGEHVDQLFHVAYGHGIGDPPMQEAAA